ncbi:epoxide hydrolase domain protein [Lojkania enalia]|uniref:Epoxide hydrolase domain protein n=1 Tax=Lojkania enalia TaxID=147567 RepID=A0A9P4KFG4_9PLEO|nr:epoxide hydrolase domain protein [Didymosphaeria enalia]
MSSTPAPFQIHIPQEKLNDIQSRIRDFPWQALSSFDNTWAHGPPPSDMRSLCEYWTQEYDWRKTEAAINKLSQFTATVGGLEIHFVHEKGSGPNPQPLLLLHGWPYSFLSYVHLIQRLAHPEHRGGNINNAFTVIVPSLPGFAFSKLHSANPTPVPPQKIAELMNELMVQVLGYKEYISHGGDWGSYISELLAFRFPQHCIGIHITMSSIRHHGAAPRSGFPVLGASPAELSFAAKEKDIWEKEKAYNMLQSTKPMKIAYAMADSPVGMLAYILEAWGAWADLRGKNLLDKVGRGRLLDEVMVYLVTDSFGTSTWIYTADYKHGSWTLPEGKKIEVPVGVLACPDPVFPMPPREVLERSRWVVAWRDSEVGGHFPFHEVGKVLVEELGQFGEGIRRGIWADEKCRK